MGSQFLTMECFYFRGHQVSISEVEHDTKNQLIASTLVQLYNP